jgi:hypothetical protein
MRSRDGPYALWNRRQVCMLMLSETVARSLRLGVDPKEFK